MKNARFSIAVDISHIILSLEILSNKEKNNKINT